MGLRHCGGDTRHRVSDLVVIRHLLGTFDIAFQRPPHHIRNRLTFFRRLLLRSLVQLVGDAERPQRRTGLVGHTAECGTPTCGCHNDPSAKFDIGENSLRLEVDLVEVGADVGALDLLNEVRHVVTQAEEMLPHPIVGLTGHIELL